MAPDIREFSIEEIFGKQFQDATSNIQGTHFVNKGLKSFDFNKSQATIPTSITMEAGGQVFIPATKTKLAFQYLENHWPVILVTAVVVGGAVFIYCKMQEKIREENK
jgi:hypothetical protein